MFKHILVPTDGSANSIKGVKQAIQLAKATRAKLTVITTILEYPGSGLDDGRAVEIPAVIKKRYYEEAAKGSTKLLDKVKSDANKAGVACQTLWVSNNALYKAIIAQAKKAKCDLIVMASRGRGGIASLLLGSETNKVLVHSKVPVLVVR